MPIFAKIDPGKNILPESVPIAQVLPTISTENQVNHRPAVRRVAGREAFSTPSISEALRDDPVIKEGQAKNNQEGKLFNLEPIINPFTQEKLIEAWKEFVEIIDAPQLKSALSCKEPLLKSEWRVEYELQTELQNQRLTQDLKPKLLGHLRRNLKNELIEIDFNISTSTEDSPVNPYTDAEKWQVLAEKYPALIALKNRFGLDFE